MPAYALDMSTYGLDDSCAGTSKFSECCIEGLLIINKQGALPFRVSTPVGFCFNDTYAASVALRRLGIRTMQLLT